MSELKPISKDSIDAVLEKAVRYRLLNEPSSADSICRDVLDIDPQNQQALVGLILALTDQFGDESYVKYALSTRGREINLIQRPRADETDVAVAAASVIARAAFVRGIARVGKDLGMRLPTGAGPDVIAAGREIIRRHGRDALRRAAKVHFRRPAPL